MKPYLNKAAGIFHRALERADIDSNAKDAVDAVKMLAEIDKLITAKAEAESAAVTASANGAASDDYLRWMTTPELEDFLRLYRAAQERKARGDAPCGDAVRRVIRDAPTVEDRVHLIERVIVYPPGA